MTYFPSDAKMGIVDEVLRLWVGTKSLSTLSTYWEKVFLLGALLGIMNPDVPYALMRIRFRFRPHFIDMEEYLLYRTLMKLLIGLMESSKAGTLLWKLLAIKLAINTPKKNLVINM